MNSIKQTDAVPLIASIINPDDTIKIARNKIRNHIDRAIKKGSLTEVSHLVFDHDDFWIWAIEKWPDLCKHPDIPIFQLVIDAESEIDLPAITSSASLLQTPPPDRRVQEIHTLQQQLIDERNENKRLNERNLELETLAKKDKRTRDKKSEAGKKAKGIKKK